MNDDVNGISHPITVHSGFSSCFVVFKISLHELLRNCLRKICTHCFNILFSIFIEMNFENLEILFSCFLKNRFPKNQLSGKLFFLKNQKSKVKTK